MNNPHIDAEPAEEKGRKPTKRSKGVKAMKKTGRLSREERQDILVLIPKLNPVEISKKLNRDVVPIYSLLNEHIPEWRQTFKDKHEEYIKKEKQILIGTEGSSWNKCSRYLPDHEGQSKEMDLDDLSVLLDEINDIKADLEMKSKIEQKQLTMITNMKNKVDEQVKHQEHKLRESFEFQKIEMSKLALLQMETYAATKAADLKCSKMERTVPIPKHTRKELLTTKDQVINDNLSKGGLYFLWRDNVVRYVGRGDILRKRLLNHDKINPNDLVSYIPYDDKKYFADELFYIWMCYPHNYLNSEVAKALAEEELAAEE